MSTPEQDPGAVGLVDWGRAGRRVRAGALALAAAVLVGWVVLSLAGDGFSGRTLGGLVGLALALLFLVELVVVGGAALRGMLRAGERGERLASDGVGLLPPRVPRPPVAPAASEVDRPASDTEPDPQ